MSVVDFAKGPCAPGGLVETHAVDSSWRKGFLAKSTTLVSGCWLPPTENNFRAISVFRGRSWSVGSELKEVSRARKKSVKPNGFQR
jgi:hypothetical protein